MSKSEFDHRVHGSVLVKLHATTSISTYEKDHCALDMDWNRVPCGRMDKACAMLAKSLCGVGDVWFEYELRALTFLTQNIF